jgi:hypothetical protein
MSGLSHEQEEESNNKLETLETLLKDTNLEVVQEEKYTESLLKGHSLTINTYLRDKNTGEKAIFHTYKFKLDPKAPKWLTKHQLWHHTDIELKQLREATALKNEKEPSKETIKAWKTALELDRKKCATTELQ